MMVSQFYIFRKIKLVLSAISWFINLVSFPAKWKKNGENYLIQI